ncbi:MAG: DEAD/DEAH box helicase [Pseudomonadota bacterium]
MNFSDLGLSAELLRAVEKQGYTQPTPIQAQAIPPVMDGRDLLASAQTGTGKTAGFTLPLLHRLQQQGAPRKRNIRILILVPTRELAAQVAESVRTYGAHLPIRSIEIFGGVSIRPQIAKLKRGVDIAIATPGRLLDHMEQGTVDLSAVETLVLDEADRMLDMGFIRDLRRIFKKLPTERQTLLFSATFSKDILKLAKTFLNNPERVEVAPRNTTAQRVSQVVHPVAQKRKRELLSFLIGHGNWTQVLVFAKTKHGSDRLAKQLNRDGLDAAAIHGNKSQGARKRALADFKNGDVRVLVATDIAARGLDIEKLPHVVNFDLPQVPEDYVHRIGRTARAGQAGHAVSLVSPQDEKLLRAVEKVTRTRIKRVVIDGYDAEPVEDTAPEKTPGRRPRRTKRGGKPAPGSKRRQTKKSGTASKTSPSGSRRRRRRQKPAR